MEEGKLFLSVTVLYCHDYLIFLSTGSFSVQVKWLKIKPFSASYNGYAYERHFLNFLDCWWLSLVSLCNSNQWFAVISSNPVQIPMLSLLAQKIRLRLLFMYFFYPIPKSVLLGWFSLGDRQLYLLQAFMPISGSGLKPTILSEYHGSCLCSSKTK